MNLERVSSHVSIRNALPDLVDSAVLVPVMPHADGPAILLGRRGDHLSSHRGQICFPGGRREPTDPDPVACALREAHEEVGIRAEEVIVLGLLDDHVTSTGFRITPVVGLLRTGREVNPTSDELVSIHQISLTRLARRETWSRETVQQGQALRIVQEVFRVDGHRVWGATARIVRQLLAVIAEP